MKRQAQPLQLQFGVMPDASGIQIFPGGTASPAIPAHYGVTGEREREYMFIAGEIGQMLKTHGIKLSDKPLAILIGKALAVYRNGGPMGTTADHWRTIAEWEIRLRTPRKRKATSKAPQGIGSKMHAMSGKNASAL